MLAKRPARLSVLVLCLALGLASCSSVQSPAEAEADVKAALESFYAAIKRGDSAGAMAVIGPEAMFVESGRLETRAEYEMNHLPLDIGFEKQVNGTREYKQLKVAGDTAWAIAATEFKGTFEGSELHFISSQLAVLSKQTDGRWLISSIHWSSRAP